MFHLTAGWCGGGVPDSATGCSGPRYVQTGAPEPSLEWPSPARTKADRHNAGTQIKRCRVPAKAPGTMRLFYLCDFNAPVLFLSLVSDGIVVPGTVVIHQLSIPLRYTGLKTRRRSVCCSPRLFLILRCESTASHLDVWELSQVGIHGDKSVIYQLLVVVSPQHVAVLQQG